MTGTVAYVPDLMDRSKVAGAASGPVTFVATPTELAEAARGASLVVVDLSRAGVLDALPDIAAPTIGFGRHDDRERLAAATAAGCDRVLARSAFFGSLPQWLAGSGPVSADEGSR